MLSTILIKLSNLNCHLIDNIILGSIYAAIMGKIIREMVSMSEVIPKVIKCFLARSAVDDALNIT